MSRVVLNILALLGKNLSKINKISQVPKIEDMSELLIPINLKSRPNFTPINIKNTLPDDMPSVYGVAKLFLNINCIISPDVENTIPIKIAEI